MYIYIGMEHGALPQSWLGGLTRSIYLSIYMHGLTRGENVGIAMYI